MPPIKTAAQAQEDYERAIAEYKAAARHLTVTLRTIPASAAQQARLRAAADFVKLKAEALARAQITLADYRINPKEEE